MKNLKKIAIPLTVGILGALFLSSCSAGIPKSATAVQNFKAEKFLGKWYEIARFDSRFEKDLSQVTAEYSKKDANSIQVKNRGYKYTKNKWREVTGEAKFVNEPKEGR